MKNKRRTSLQEAIFSGCSICSVFASSFFVLVHSTWRAMCLVYSLYSFAISIKHISLDAIYVFHTLFLIAVLRKG